MPTRRLRGTRTRDTPAALANHSSRAPWNHSSRPRMQSRPDRRPKHTRSTSVPPRVRVGARATSVDELPAIDLSIVGTDSSGTFRRVKPQPLASGRSSIECRRMFTRCDETAGERATRQPARSPRMDETARGRRSRSFSTGRADALEQTSAVAVTRLRPTQRSADPARSARGDTNDSARNSNLNPRIAACPIRGGLWGKASGKRVCVDPGAA